MEIEKVFGKLRMIETRKTYDQWWEQKTDRPLAGVAVKNRIPDLPTPKVSLITQANCNDLNISVDDILDAIEYEACSYTYYGDSFPFFSLDCFGPGIVAAILGAKLDNSTGSVWFSPKEIKEPTELKFEFSKDNPWFVRLKHIMKRSVERFEGNILLSMPDLSGIMDILAVFRPSEMLLFDLYDYQDEVKLLSKEIYKLWMEIYWEFARYLNMDEFGYTDWSTLLSSKPSYVIQSDFSYMISEDMFLEFIYPSLERFCEDIPRTIFHMDGPGEIKHLDKLLTLEKLNAVQWVPGDGNPTCENYPELYKKIDDSNKNIQIPGHGLDKMLAVSKQIAHPNRIHHMMVYCSEGKKDKNLELLKTLKII